MKEAKGQCIKRAKAPDSIDKPTRLCIPVAKKTKYNEKGNPDIASIKMLIWLRG